MYLPLRFRPAVVPTQLIDLSFEKKYVPTDVNDVNYAEVHGIDPDDDEDGDEDMDEEEDNRFGDRDGPTIVRMNAAAKGGNRFLSSEVERYD